jgi:hypothetical protein
LPVACAPRRARTRSLAGAQTPGTNRYTRINSTGAPVATASSPSPGRGGPPPASEPREKPQLTHAAEGQEDALPDTIDRGSRRQEPDLHHHGVQMAAAPPTNLCAADIQ